MRNKKKGINDDTEIGTVSTLLKRINEEYSKRQKEVEIQDRANEELLTTATKKEKLLIEEIGEAKKIVSKMISDYGKIEADVEVAERKKIEENVLREADVKSGKVSLREFRTKGKYDVKIAGEVLAKSVQELEATLSVIRKKGLAILKTEERLGDCRNTIRNLTIRPGMVMLEMLKGLYEFTDVEVASFMSELDSLRTEWDQTKQNLLLADGKSISGRHVFERLTMEQAKALQFSPLLPLSCVEKLKSELVKYEESENISITYYVNLKTIEITSIIPRSSGAVQIAHLKEVPGAKFTREKAGK